MGSTIKMLIINVVVLGVVLLLFEPTIKSDDYDLSMVLYGALNGEYSSITMYCLPSFGAIIKSLLIIIPEIPWYAVVNYIFIFLSLFFISIVFCRYKNRCLLFEIVLLPFFAYELYIRMTFTKTAGIIIISGLLVLLYLIDCSSKNKAIWGCSIAWILMGISIRSTMLNLILEVFISAFIISFFVVKNERKKIIIIKFIITVLALLFLGKILFNVNSDIKNNYDEWVTYSQYNNARARLQDYYMPEYDDFEESYKEIGVSKNDYIAFKTWGLYIDYDFFTIERLNAIASIDEMPAKSNLFDTVMKNLFSYYFSETGFYFLLLVMMLFFCANGVSTIDKSIIVVSVGGCSFLAYAYMSYLGRLQHHVDLSIMIAATVLVMYYYYKYDCSIKNKRQALLVVVIIITVFLCRFNTSISKASYYANDVENQKKLYDDNKKIMDLLSNDKEHVYVFCPHTTNFFYDCIFEPFEVIPKGYYSNLEMTNRYRIPSWDSIAIDYGIDNYFKEATDSAEILFVDSDINNGWIDVVQTFINEHYCSGAEYELVNKYGTINIYRFIDKSGDIEN
ncbi:hypothetical protein [Pseudobutyrivibrio ruminis]|nr:hypothetical protein [Pseudobutyrivibrio ruminis]